MTMLFVCVLLLQDSSIVNETTKVGFTTRVTLSLAETKASNFSLRPNEYAKCLKPRFRPIVPSHWQTRKHKFSVFGPWRLLYRCKLQCHS